MKPRFKIQYEFAGCIMPMKEIASTLGIAVADSYASRSKAQEVCDSIARAMFALGFKEVRLWTVGTI